MPKKIISYTVFTIAVIVLQLVLAPWMSIIDIRPDFILIFLLFLARLEGRLAGQLYGFGIGLFSDLIGMGSFLGVSALAKTVAGFLGGYLQKQRSRLNVVLYHGLGFIAVFMNFLLLYSINYKGTDFGFQHILLRYIFPATFYTFVLYLILDYFFPVDAE
jgi:rod shape-determining protein MreD